MGTIKVRGYAEKALNADQIIFTISFISKDIKTAGALDTAKKQCDLFLEEIDKKVSIFQRFICLMTA